MVSKAEPAPASGSSSSNCSSNRCRASDVRERLKRRSQKVDRGVAVSRHQVEANERDRRAAQKALERKREEAAEWERELATESERQKLQKKLHLIPPLWKVLKTLPITII